MCWQGFESIGVDPNSAIASRPPLAGGHPQLVKVARVVVVNREPDQVPQVVDVSTVFRAGLARGFCVLQGRGGNGQARRNNYHAWRLQVSF